MDRRKIKIDTQSTIFDSLDSDEVNLELAQNIETMIELKDIIKSKAVQSFEEQANKDRILTFFKSQQHLEDNPRSVYVLGTVGWLLMYRIGAASKSSLLWFYFCISIYYNYKRQSYCKMQPEYPLYKHLNDNFRRVVELKKRSMGIELFIKRSLGVEYNKLDENLKFIKYENLF